MRNRPFFITNKLRLSSKPAIMHSMRAEDIDLFKQSTGLYEMDLGSLEGQADPMLLEDSEKLEGLSQINEAGIPGEADTSSEIHASGHKDEDVSLRTTQLNTKRLKPRKLATRRTQRTSASKSAQTESSRSSQCDSTGQVSSSGSASGGYYKYRCKYWLTHNCRHWVWVNNASCAHCLVY